MFDALVTGGIPILPRSLMGLTRLSGLQDDEAVYYDAIDIVKPDAIVSKANRLYDRLGMEGKMARVQRALSRHHLDSRISQIAGIGTKIIRDIL
jgi:hypothetical protein